MQYYLVTTRLTTNSHAEFQLTTQTLLNMGGELLFLNSSWGTHELSWVAECRLANLSWPPNSQCKLNQGIREHWQKVQRERREFNASTSQKVRVFIEFTCSTQLELSSESTQTHTLTKYHNTYWGWLTTICINTKEIIIFSPKRELNF